MIDGVAVGGTGNQLSNSIANEIDYSHYQSQYAKPLAASAPHNLQQAHVMSTCHFSFIHQQRLLLCALCMLLITFICALICEAQKTLDSLVIGQRWSAS